MSVISLQSLQSQVRKDPASYREDFIMQFRHFESISDSLHLSPGRPSKQYSDLLHFVSHCYSCYRSLHAELGLEALIHKTLTKEPERLHQSMRRSLVQAALVLRSKGSMDFMRNFEKLFVLNAVDDKEMRKLLFHGLLSDIGNSTVPNKRLPKGENPALNRKAVQSYLSGVLRNSSSPVGLVRAAGGLLLAAFKKNIWRDSAVANAISEDVVLSQNDSKTAMAGVYLLLGNFKQAMRISDACEDSEARSAKLKKKAKVDGEETDDEDVKISTMIDFTAIDLLNDSQSYVERLFAKAEKKTMPFDQRLLFLQLVARLVGRHELLLLNFYPYIVKFLRANNQGVTRLLAAFTEASHSLVPPDELQPVVKHVLEFFVAEHCRPEVIAIGINTLRAMAARAPLALTADQVQHLCDFRESKNRTVVGASRAILNLYREKFPELLPRKLRGKDAAIAVSAGNSARPEFGRKELVLEDLPGIRCLRANENDQDNDSADGSQVSDDEDNDSADGSQVSDDEENDSADGSQVSDDEENDMDTEIDDDQDEDADEGDSENGEVESEDENTEEEGRRNLSIATERVLDDEDFKRMRRKRKADDMESNDSDEDSNQDDGGEFQAMDPNSLAPKRRPSASLTKKQARVATILEGKTDKKLFKKKDRRGGSTNKEKIRNKPIMMSTQKRKQRNSQMSANDKAKHLKKHIKNLRKKVGGVQKRRRG